MYKIMLVDDEAGVRNSIKAKMDWEAAGFEIAVEASNGKEALDALDLGENPDLVITDIRMPQMDGIAFIRECKQRYPHLRTIVLSGYSDFEYLKAAIQSGVKDYLLKPVVRSELQALLAKLADELKAERLQSMEAQLEQHAKTRQLQMLQEQTILQLVKEETFSMAALKERLQQLQLTPLAVDDLQAQFAAVEMRVMAGRLSDWNGRKDLLQLAFQMLCRETADRWKQVYPFYDVNYPSMMFFLVNVNGDEGVRHEPADAFAQELKRNMNRFLQLESVIGIGEPVTGLRQLKNGYASALWSWSQSTIHHIKRSGSESIADMSDTFSPESERKLTLAIENVDMKAFTRQLHQIFPADQDTPMFAFTFLALRVILLFMAVAKKFELGDSSLQTYLWNTQMTVRDGRSREQVLEQLQELAQLVMNEVKRTRFSNGQHMAAAVRKYVDDNYTYDLTLASLAEMFHINETYLSGLFKQNAGITFSEYVTKQRMHKARRLLEEYELKLTDIATLVGYSSSSYFSTSFKKYYGKSPKEYRDELMATSGTA
ncbi:response regulator transcription factor [Paenibacillus beijingensis]|uniref:AraC family transcriptional regulator n=1 Tax=Paenibacillus beijingensis TaxID=1126833 RepID=A0A0D5NFW8_9BACL|nr:helix-turn-helix domain-containing protein [Paenibacillus beijingensis]AJY73872.1 hypothetical protein VN24_03660 [Paenibacillus beijingensis]